ncbi:MAG: GNAT family N-acetyltransferase [Lachnospiraceae bacterium]|nr:GNAT family N-acetyltransferase [Lachnospiraceae bacterium]
MNYEIKHLEKDLWKDHMIPLNYASEFYYDVEMKQKEDSFQIELNKKRLDVPCEHKVEDYDFPDKLYQDWCDKACAWGIEENGTLLAVIETAEENWNNRLRITELWVDEKLRGKGIGHDLIEIAKDQARLERKRAVVLETQSNNANAIGFYMHEGFSLIGFDTISYSNQDVEKKEVRLELGYVMERKARLQRSQIEIRPERADEYKEVERITQEAFWNRHGKGCNEHYLVHILRDSEDYLPDLSRIAVVDGEIVGTIMFSKAQVRAENQVHDIITFGPLCVKPKWHGCGIGEMLMEETFDLARKAGYPGIVIFGEPDYYPRVGFRTCDHFGITTPDGKNFDAFMGYELQTDGFKDIHGKFYESSVFEKLEDEKVEEFTKKFPLMKKQYYPSQW